MLYHLNKKTDENEGSYQILQAKFVKIKNNLRVEYLENLN